MNYFLGIGRITKEPELRYTPNGVANIKFTIAVNRTFKNAQGDYDADFISCEAWKQTAEFIANNHKKGSPIGIMGSIRTGSYEGQDGKRVYTTDVNVQQVTPVVFMSGQAQDGGGGQPQQQGGGYSVQPQPQPQAQGGGYGGGQPQSQSQGGGYGGGQPQQNYSQSVTQHDPFANAGIVLGVVEVKEDDLPF